MKKCRSPPETPHFHTHKQTGMVQVRRSGISCHPLAPGGDVKLSDMPEGIGGTGCTGPVTSCSLSPTRVFWVVDHQRCRAVIGLARLRLLLSKTQFDFKVTFPYEMGSSKPRNTSVCILFCNLKSTTVTAAFAFFI